VKVYSYAESRTIFSAGQTLYLEELNATVSLRKILDSGPHKKGFRVVFEGVTTPESASQLVGASLFIERSTLPELNDGTYYWCDLIGMEVYTEDAEFIGWIDTIIPTGSNDVYVIKDSRKGGKGETLIPALASVVKTVDVQKGVMRVMLPEGL
jgi:16S rRNA processing protein RimM